MSKEPSVRLTQPALKVLRALFEQPKEGLSGADFARITGVSSGTLYPLLSKFERVGWVKGQWELSEPSEIGRPRRRFYKLTGTGYRVAQSELGQLQVRTGGLVWTN